MNTSRIEVPLTLSPPHFDDDATIATARQVVPINGARKTVGRRMIVSLLPLLLASTLCGALGAIAVNYFERRPDNAVSIEQQQPLSNGSAQTQVKTEPTPVAAAPEMHAKNTEIQADQPEKTAVTPADEPPSKSEAPKAVKREEERKSAPSAPVKHASTEDAAKLVRKRRVEPADSEIPLRRNRRSTAGQIEDLFTGPNP